MQFILEKLNVPFFNLIINDNFCDCNLPDVPVDLHITTLRSLMKSNKLLKNQNQIFVLLILPPETRHETVETSS